MVNYRISPKHLANLEEGADRELPLPGEVGRLGRFLRNRMFFSDFGDVLVVEIHQNNPWVLLDFLLMMFCFWIDLFMNSSDGVEFVVPTDFTSLQYTL